MAQPISFERSNEELEEQLDITRQISDALRDQVNISRRLGGDQSITLNQLSSINKLNRDLNNLNITLLGQSEQRNKFLRNEESIEKDLIKLLRNKGSLEAELKSASDKKIIARNAGDIAQARAFRNIELALEKQIRINESINESLNLELNIQNKINDALGITSDITEGIGKLMKDTGFGRLADQLGITDAIEKNRQFATELIETKRANALAAGEDPENIIISSLDRFKVMGNLAKELGGNLTKALGPLSILIGIIDAVKDLDKDIGKTAKELGTSYNNAASLSKEFNSISNESENIFVTTANINEAFLDINRSLGTNGMLSKEMLITYTELTKQAGLSSESALSLTKIQAISGKSANETTEAFLGQVVALNGQNKAHINGKTLLNDISNVSKATLLTFKGQGGMLADAAFQAKLIGSNLKEVEGIQQSLLNIESSIGAEFEAEVMTGKQLNLEKARYYALTNDISNLSKEIAKQDITADSFGKMNVLQQEAIAKSLGMSRDSMGNMLFEQEALSKLGMSDTEDGKKKLALLEKQGFSAQAIAEAGKTERENMLASASSGEKFLQIIEKLKEVFVTIAEPLMPVLSSLVDIMAVIVKPFVMISELFGGWGTSISNVLGPLGKFKDILKAAAYIAVGFAAYSAYGMWAASVPVVGPIIGAAAAAAAIAAGTSFIGSIKDGVIDPKKGLVVSGEYGSVQLDPNDQIIAGTDLYGGKQNSQTNNEGGISILASTLGNKLDIMINKLDNLIGAVNKGMVVNLDGIRVSNELSVPNAIMNRKI